MLLAKAPDARFSNDGDTDPDETEKPVMVPFSMRLPDAAKTAPPLSTV